MEREEKKIDLFIFDADQLIDKIIPIKSDTCYSYEVLTGTKDFIKSFYNKLEEYRLVRGIDDIVVFVTTSKGREFLDVYHHLLYNLNEKINIKFGNGIYGFTPLQTLSFNFVEENEYTVDICNIEVEYCCSGIESNLYDYYYSLFHKQYTRNINLQNVIGTIPLYDADSDKTLARLERLNRHINNWKEKHSYQIRLRDINRVKRDGLSFNRQLLLK